MNKKKVNVNVINKYFIHDVKNGELEYFETSGLFIKKCDVIYQQPLTKNIQPN